MPGYSAMRSATLAAGVRITMSIEGMRLRAVPVAELSHLGVIRVRRHHRCELGR